jgi:hypothetical protein
LSPATESHSVAKAKADDRAEAERLADAWLERLLIFGERAGGTITGKPPVRPDQLPPAGGVERQPEPRGA